MPYPRGAHRLPGGRNYRRVVETQQNDATGTGSGSSGAAAPANTVAPAVTGTATVGQTLTTTNGTWSNTPTSYTYQWQRNSVNIGSATASTYLLVDADYTKAVRCVVTATNAAGSGSANSNATAAVIRTYAQEVAADSPGVYWKLDETSGTAVTDYAAGAATGGTHTTTAGTGPTVNQTPLISVGKSVLYAKATNTGHTTGPADGASSPADLGDTFTLEAWIKLTSVGTYQHFIDKGTNAYALRVNPSGNIEFLRAGVANIVASTITLSTATTYHCVLTKAAATVVMWVNGVDVTGVVTNATCADNNSAFIVGRDNPLASFYFDGIIDEVAVYPTALSAARVAAHYAARV